MKIAIITLVGNFNYGNRLQNYALQEILMKKYKYEVDNLIFSDGFLYTPHKNKKSIISRLVSKFVKLPQIVARKKQFRLKKSAFIPFQDYNFNFVDVNVANALTIANKYERFIIGSDQVWNPIYQGEDNAMYGTFAPSEKVVSYAASFGLSKIPEEFEEYVKKGLNNVSKISVREEEGLQIIKDLTGRDAELVLDPTMLLTGNQWHEIVKSAEQISENNEPYVVMYVLGELSNSSKQNINKFIEKHNFKLYTIMGELATNDAVIPDPLGFVKLIENAEFVFTDSFHATVFSIMMHTPFKIYSRDGGEMNSRITTLLNNAGLSSELINNENVENIFSELSLDDVDEKIEKIRKQSLIYLEEAIQ